MRMNVKEQIETDLLNRCRFMEELIREVLTVKVEDKAVQARIDYFKQGAEQIHRLLSDQLNAVRGGEVSL